MAKMYTLLKEHIERCKFSYDEWCNLFWDVDIEPNSSDDGIHCNYYDFELGFDSMDPGLLNGHTTEMYYLTLYSDEAPEKYTAVKKLLEQNPPLYNKEHSKRCLSEEEIHSILEASYGKENC